MHRVSSAFCASTLSPDLQILPGDRLDGGERVLGGWEHHLLPRASVLGLLGVCTLLADFPEARHFYAYTNGFFGGGEEATQQSRCGCREGVGGKDERRCRASGRFLI